MAAATAMLGYPGLCVGTSLAHPSRRTQRAGSAMVVCTGQEGQQRRRVSPRPRRRPKWEPETASRRRVADFLRRLEPVDGESAAVTRRRTPGPGQWDRAFRALGGTGSPTSRDLAWELWRAAIKHDVTDTWDVGVFNAAIKALAGGPSSRVGRVVQQLRSVVQVDNYTLTLLAANVGGEAGRGYTLDELLVEWRAACDAGLIPDTVTVTAVLKACTHASQPALAQAIYDEALRLGCVPNKWVLTALLQAQANGADVTAAAAAVAAMDAARATGVTLELDTECVYALIRAYCAAEMHEDAMALLQQSPFAELATGSTFGVLLTAAAEEHDGGLRAAQAVWEASVAAGTPASAAMAGVLQRQASTDHSATREAAVETFVQLGSALGARTYAPMVRACVEAGDVAGALRVMSSATTLLALPKSTVDAVLRLCAKERRGAAALEALRSAERVGLPVDVTMFTTAVAACARKGQLPLAMEVYDSARAQGLANDPILINALINTCAKAGEPDAAIGVVAEALRARVKLDAFSITSFISAFARKGQLSDALAAYQLGRWLDVPPSTVVTNALIHACAKASDHRRALEVYEQALAEGVEPDSNTINSLIHACAQGGDPHAASEVLKDGMLRGIAADAVTFTALISAWARVRNVDRALQVYGLAQSVGVQPTSIMVNAVLTAAARAKQPAAAIGVFAEARRMGLDVDHRASNALVRSFLAAGNASEALVAWQLGEWLGATPSKPVTAALRSACAAAGLEAEFRATVAAVEPSLPSKASKLPSGSG